MQLATQDWRVACIALALGTATVTGPLIVGVIAGKCAYACLWAAGAIAGLLLLLQNALTQARLCDKNCALQFPPIRKPPARPPGGVAFSGASARSG